MNATALIAEDEPLLAEGLAAMLRRLWPDLDVVATAGSGPAAVALALAHRPDVLFLDVRMPGSTGIEAAEAIAEDWPEGQPLPLTVFVTAYDAYALRAFDVAAVDYLLKPVRPDRLALTCTRLQDALAGRQAGRSDPLAQLRALLGSATGTAGGLGSIGETALGFGDGRRLRDEDARHAGDEAARGTSSASQPAPPRLTMLQAGAGAAIHLVRVDDVVYFEAADKYVRVVTAEREHLIRLSLRELLPQLDPQRFWQVHRGTVVRVDAVDSALRDEAGKVTLALRDRPERLAVSRLHAHLFKPM